MEINLTDVKGGILKEIVKSFRPDIIIREKDVIYLMVLFRKVLEIENCKKDYLALNFYINWCLHAYLDKDKQIYRSLNKLVAREFIDSNRIRVEKGLSPLREEDKKNLWGDVVCRNVIEANQIKVDFENFFKERGLSMLALSDRKWWKNFRLVLVEILVKTPLIIKDNNCLLNMLLIESGKNSILRETNTTTHVADFILVFKDGDRKCYSFLDGS